ncbi:MAG: MmgE/PrpD family protein [Candidatus Caldarchaeum sp.]|nr:MmgE/PrpD family protein [Candidatus Caldarchaeum sp.]MDW8063379.1 MmgE/PrpD family protein [Candidatus Caldarchaeum sp.]
MLSAEFSRFAENLRINDIPQNVVAKAKLHLLDTIGVTAVGSLEPRIFSLMNAMKKMNDQGQSTVFWYGSRFPSPTTALVNGAMAHALEYDDTHLGSVIHLSAPIVATVLAVGEALHSSGAEILTALIAGYEVTARIGMAARGKFHQRGFHATSVCGTLGCALAAGMLLGYDADKLSGAMGIAGSMSSGLMEFLSDGSWIKPLHAGWAAHAGTLAALLAGQGLSGPKTVIEGKRGIYAAFAGHCPPTSDIAGELGKRWETLNISFKLFPNCHLIHEFMRTIQAIKKEHNVNSVAIAKIVCYVDELSYSIICPSSERKIIPETRYDAMFSLPYGVALTFVKDSIDVQDFDVEKGVPTEVRELLKKVEFKRADDRPRQLVVVHLRNGEKLTASQSLPRTPPPEAVVSKYMKNVSPLLDHEQATELLNTVMKLEKLADIRELVKHLICSHPFAK